MSPLEIVGLVFAGLFVGGLSALLGIGGGVVLVPLLVLFGKSQHLAEGTSLLVIVPTAAAGVWAHTRSGFVNARFAVLLGAGGVVGAWVGARVALAVDAGSLQRIFAVFMLAVGAKLLRDGLRST